MHDVVLHRVAYPPDDETHGRNATVPNVHCIKIRLIGAASARLGPWSIWSRVNVIHVSLTCLNPTHIQHTYNTLESRPPLTHAREHAASRSGELIR